MGFLKKLLIVVVLIVILFFVIGLFLPSTAHVERSTQIQAPKSLIFAAVNGYRNFNQWSPWSDRDPNAEYAFEGADLGVGAKMSWTSDQRDVGSGSQEIVESVPNERIKVRLDFGSQGTADAFFKLEGVDGAVTTTWGFDTDFGFNIISRYFGLMFEKWIGPDYEKGLANLKTWVESLPKTDISTLKAEPVIVDSMPIAYLSASCGPDDAEIAKALTDAYGKIGQYMADKGLTASGQPITINTAWGDAGYECDAAIPIDAIPVDDHETASEVKIGKTYAGKAIKAVHVGAYQDLPKTYAQIDAFMQAYGFEAVGRSWDQYVSDPMTTPQDELITHIFFPVK